VLSNIAFNSASKRHRPNLRVGQCIICHVIRADPSLEIELSCEDPTSQKDWVTNEVYFGPLPDGGLLFDLPFSESMRLASNGSQIFDIVGQYLKPFETCVGVNGRVFIRAGDGNHLRASLIANIITKATSLKQAELEEICQDAERRLTQQ
jgi:exosome complex component RRP40